MHSQVIEVDSQQVIEVDSQVIEVEGCTDRSSDCTNRSSDARTGHSCQVIERAGHSSRWIHYCTIHLFFLLFWKSTAFIASSNTALSPSFVLAEHSMYLTALIFLANS